MLVPKLFTTLKTYDRAQFTADLTAGVIVGIVALPLAIAFAIASGVTPDRGLYTAIIAGFLISALGGSRVQIGGPTGAFVVIVYGIVREHGVEGLTVATLMAGFILIVFGVVRLGGAIKFIPFPVTIGFTSGRPLSSRPPPINPPNEAIMPMAPDRVAAMVMISVSRFFTCASSCAITAVTSSRVRLRSRPVVAATAACWGSRPVAKALG